MKWGGVKLSNTEQYKSPEQLAKSVMDKSVVELGKLSDTEYLAKVKEARAMMQELNNSKTNTVNSGGDTPLEDVFYVTEGMFNNQYGDLQANFSGLERIESYYTVDIHLGTNGDYYIYNSDLTTLYNDLATQMNTETGNDSDRILVLCDLTLENINIPSGSNTGVGTAGINCGMAYAPLQPFFTLANAAWAAEQKGDCPTSTNVYDAADFIKAYANNTVTYPSCANGYYTIVHTGWISYDGNFAPSWNYWLTHAWAYAWHDEYNVCLGNSNAEWYTLYSQMDLLRNEGLAWAQSVLPNTPNLQFLFTDYHSHGASDANGNPLTLLPDGTYGFYHGGVFGYGVIICQ